MYYSRELAAVMKAGIRHASPICKINEIIVLTHKISKFKMNYNDEGADL